MFVVRARFQWIMLFLLLPVLVWGQGTYYAGIDTGSASFVTDLHNLIYPHTQISYDQYDETNVANFASRDTSGGQKTVTCVYSGQNYVYTPPFAWGTFSREHTWCYSWMPTWGSTSGKEYSDQHHLFPTNQNNANGVRSNHPLGSVTTVVSSYLLSKYGKNSSNQNVFEPRDSHKGDAARALMYMAVCYNGVNGNDWTFNQLNSVTLPGLSEAPQSVDLLIQWHNQDPPDDWERARNEYIYSIQGNRNPFVDHPEYVNLIDFNTLTKKSTAVLADEPTNYPNGYNTPTITSSSITVTWSDPSGTVLPTGYMLYANTSGTFADPVDGTVYADDTNLSDGSAKVNIPYGAELNDFTGLSSATNYTFRLVPYNGSGGARKYKTASFPSSLVQTYATTGSPSGTTITSTTYSYAQNFDGLASSGSSLTWTDNSTIPGWYSNRTTYTAGTGSSNTGSLYSFGATSSTERSLGSAASGSTTTILYAVRFTNNSGSTLTTFPIRYTGEQWRNGGNTTAQKLTFDYKINATSISDASGWIAVPSLDFTGPIATATAGALDGNDAANRTVVSATITTSVANGETIWFRWKDIDDAGTDHGLSIDDFSLNQSGALLPVELASFSATPSGTGILLSWSTASEVNNRGFDIERCSSGTEWKTIGFVEGNGTSNSPRSYSFVDARPDGGTVQYRLKQIDNDGTVEYSSTVEITTHQPSRFSLEQNFPNPFNPVTTIRFTLPASGHTTVSITNTLGQQVAVLTDAPLNAGTYSVPFDASFLSGGMYFYTLRSGNFSATKKLLLVK